MMNTYLHYSCHSGTSIKTLLIMCFIFVSPVLIAKTLTQDELNMLVNKTQKHGDIPALTIAVIQSEKIIYSISGTIKIDSTKRAKLNHKFHLGSNSKAITSFIAMKLVEQGKISLDTSLYDLFPELKNDKFVHVTLADFLSHRSQIIFYSNNAFASKPFQGTVSEKRYQLAQYLFTRKPKKKVFNYSNAGYAIVALMLEKVSKQSFEQLLETTMKELNLSYFIGFPNEESKDSPWGHQKVDGRLKPFKPSFLYGFPDYLAPAGDISMSVIDYAKFVQLHLKGMRGIDNYLKANNYDQLHYGLKGYAYGWANKTKGKVRSSSHFGSLGTYYSYTVIIDEVDLAIVFMLNTIGNKQVKATYRLVAKLIELMYE